MKWRLLLLLSFVLSACQPQTMAISLTTATNTRIPESTATIAPTRTPTKMPPSPMPMTPTNTMAAFQICSPLEEETFETLPLILVNPIVIPQFGRDDGHHGLDFAYYRRGDRESIQGIEVYAILSGKTALTLENETPYGYTLVVETPLSDLPESLQDLLNEIYQPVPDDVFYQGDCPEINPPKITGVLSLYHLYAHLEEKPDVQPGDPIACGSTIGTVGNSGRSSNPHLHLETRLGPSNADLGNMAFYETIYSEEQRANYCLWRMSGYFQLFDPFLLFDAGA